jgi:hypothetical protein
MAANTYPGPQNNHPGEDQIFRDKATMNHRAGFIEFDNTEGQESITIKFKNGDCIKMSDSGIDYVSTRGTRSLGMGDSHTTQKGSGAHLTEGNKEEIIYGTSFRTTGQVSKWIKETKEHFNLQQKLHDIKRLFDIKRTNKEYFGQAPNQQRQGSFSSCKQQDVPIEQIATETPSKFVPGELSCDDPQPPMIEKIIEKTETITESSGKFGWECFDCWGTNQSPSTQDGNWEKEQAKEEIEKIIEDLTIPLAEKEELLNTANNPEGGSEINAVAKNRVETIGTTFNSRLPYRIDPIGKRVPYGVKIDPFGKGIYTQYRESMLLEKVHTDDTIGGNWDVMVCNKWNVSVGANGVNFNTLGDFKMFGSAFQLSGFMGSITALGELHLAGERLDLEGDIITLRPRGVKREIEDVGGGARNLPANDKRETEKERQVLIDGNLNVQQNVIIRGGAHIEGQLSVQHIAAPLEWHMTEQDFEITEPGDCDEPMKSVATHADMLEGHIIGYVTTETGTYPVISACAPNAILVHNHHHYFAAPAMRLFHDKTQVEVGVGGKKATQDLLPHEAVRAIGSRNNFDHNAYCFPINDAIHPSFVYQKFGGSCEPLKLIDNTFPLPIKEEKTRPDGKGIRTTTDEKFLENKKEKHSEISTKITEMLDKLYEGEENTLGLKIEQNNQ